MKMPHIDIRKTPKFTMSITLDLDLIMKIDKLSKESNKSLSETMREIIREALK